MIFSERQRSPRLRVLVVEDEPDTRQTWLVLLRSLGHAVEAVADGPAALRAAESRWPDVVLLDLGLPGLSGYEVAQRLRQTPGRARPLLIAISGLGEDVQRRRSYEVGIDLHLVKPVEVKELTAFLEHFQRVSV